MKPETGTSDDLAEAADLVGKVSSAKTNGEALALILSYRKRVRREALAATAPAPVAPTGLFTWCAVDGKQHDTGRVMYGNRSYFATTANPEDARRIAEAMNAAPAVPVAPPHEHVQSVPDHCDRIVWRNRYYHLPLEAASVAPPDHKYTNQEIAEATEAAPVAEVLTDAWWTDAKLCGIASDYFHDEKDWPAAIQCMRHMLMEQRARAVVAAIAKKDAT